MRVKLSRKISNYIRRITDLQNRKLDRLLPMVVQDSEEELFRGRVTAGFLFYIYLAGSIMACFRLLFDGLQPATIATFLTMQIFLAGLYFLKIRGDAELARETIILAGIITITIILLTDHGLYSRVLVWIPLMPVVANFFHCKITGVSTLLIFISILTVFYWMHFQEIVIAPVNNDILLQRLIATIVASTFATAISYFYEESRRRANVERDKLEQMRREWISVVSHELRTPLTAMHGAISLLNHGLFDEQPEKATKLINVAFSNTERLVRLVNDVLDIEKIESGKFSLSLAKVDCLDIMQEAIVTQMFSAKKKSINIQLLATDSFLCNLDKDRILQVLQNLLSNAIKFAPEKSVIELDIQKESVNYLRLQVVDQGPGIPEVFTSKLFQRFEQAESSDNRKQEGSGLGLHICKAIVEKHKGNIGFENLTKGGCMFYVRLPLNLPVLPNSSSERSSS